VRGGDWISADQKNKGRARFRGWTKLVFTANKIPRFTDETWAFRRRFVEVQLPFKFVQKVNPDEPNERRGDPEILDKIASSSELSGLANLIAARLPWIIKNCQIYRKPGHYEAYKEQTDSVITFLERYCTFFKDASSIKMPVNKLHGYFKRWADLTMGNLVDARWFGRFVKRHCDGRSPIETTINGHTCTVYPGLAFDEIKYNAEIAELERRLIGSNRKDIGSLTD
jgi:phage/plasmid-associated DNA primase